MRCAPTTVAEGLTFLGVVSSQCFFICRLVPVLPRAYNVPGPLNALPLWFSLSLSSSGSLSLSFSLSHSLYFSLVYPYPLSFSIQSLGWHSWRVLAARAAFPTPPGSNPSPPAKPTLADGHALLHAVISPGNGSGGSGAKPVAVLEGAALATAAASAEFAALREAVAAKDAAATMAWKWRDAATSGSGGGGWGRAFPAPPSTTWKEAVAVAAGGGQRRHVVAEWETWRKSASGLVKRMEGVLAGVVDAAPSLRSALESQLQARYKADVCRVMLS